MELFVNACGNRGSIELICADCEMAGGRFVQRGVGHPEGPNVSSPEFEIDLDLQGLESPTRTEARKGSMNGRRGHDDVVMRDAQDEYRTLKGFDHVAGSKFKFSRSGNETAPIPNASRDSRCLACCHSVPETVRWQAVPKINNDLKASFDAAKI